ncbi:ABC transporter ATP-binding protein, partial [bacterium]|nr:ABC transporter ATP-binding protein [bacterium]
MNYNLNQTASTTEQKKSSLAALKKLLGLIREERRTIILAMIIIFINAGLSLVGPFLIGHTIDTYIQSKQFQGVIMFSGILLSIYMVGFVTNYLQMTMMGGVAIRMLYSLRNAVFNKLEELP